MKNKIDTDKILKKDFEIELKGYKVQAVDSYLDELCLKIDSLQDEMVELEKANSDLKRIKEVMEKKINDLQVENAKLKSKKAIGEVTSDVFLNAEVIERIARLEETIKKLNDYLITK